jgi:hypothetical protein
VLSVTCSSHYLLRSLAPRVTLNVGGVGEWLLCEHLLIYSHRSESRTSNQKLLRKPFDQDPGIQLFPPIRSLAVQTRFPCEGFLSLDQAPCVQLFPLIRSPVFKSVFLAKGFRPGPLYFHIRCVQGTSELISIHNNLSSGNIGLQPGPEDLQHHSQWLPPGPISL